MGSVSSRIGRESNLVVVDYAFAPVDRVLNLEKNGPISWRIH